jgi:hypothetical protein
MRCGENFDMPGTGCPRFSAEARAAGGELGGLLKIYSAAGNRVKHVGWCSGGAIGMDAMGSLIWVADWGHMSSVSVDGTDLRFGDRPADVETGRLLDLPSKR